MAMSVVGDVVHCIHQKKLDQGVLVAFKQEIEWSTRAKVLALRNLSEHLGLAPDLSDDSGSEVSSSSDSSASEVDDLVPYGSEKSVSAMSEQEVEVFFRFGLPLVQALRPCLGECASGVVPSILSSWASFALNWCVRGSSLELHAALEPFLVDVLLAQLDLPGTDDSMDDESCLSDLVELVVIRSVAGASESSTKDVSMELDALLQVVRHKPAVFFTAVHMTLKNRQLSLQRQAMHWVLLGHVAIQPWFDAGQFTASSLWVYLTESPASQGLATAVLLSWFLSLLVSSPTPWLDSSNTGRVLRPLRQAIATCAAELPSLVNPSDLAKHGRHAILGQLQLADVIPAFTREQVEASFSSFLSHIHTQTNEQSAGEVVDRVDPLPVTMLPPTFEDAPRRGFVVQQVEFWIGSATSTTGGAGIRALRATLRDEFGSVHVLPLHGDASAQHDAFGTRHVFALDADESITRIDVSCYENLHAKLPSHRRRTFLGAVRFTTTKHEYPWIGTPSRLSNLDLSIKSSSAHQDNDEAAVASEALAVSPHPARDDVLVGLCGTFDDDGLLVSLGGYFAQSGGREGRRIVVQTALGLVSYVFRSVYTLAPWDCLSYFHENPTEADSALVQGLFLQVRHHPRLFHDDGIPSPNEAPSLLAWLSCSCFKESTDEPPTRDAMDEGPAVPTMDRFHAHAMDALQDNIRRLRVEAVALRESRAQEWWCQRELAAEKEINSCLHKQLHVQRAQILAFEKERRKWEHEVQRRISKYATDRKVSSEQNMELQDQVQALELQVKRSDGQVKALTASSAELEGTVDELRRRTAHTQQLERQVDELKAQLARRDDVHAAEVDRLAHLHAEEIDDLKYTWSSALEKFRSAPQQVHVQHGAVDAGLDDKRVAELEKALKQKDQAIQVLKGMLERQQSIAEDKISLANSKYDHVKAINFSLQRRVVGSQTRS